MIVTKINFNNNRPTLYFKFVFILYNTLGVITGWFIIAGVQMVGMILLRFGANAGRTIGFHWSGSGFHACKNFEYFLEVIGNFLNIVCAMVTLALVKILSWMQFWNLSKRRGKTELYRSCYLHNVYHTVVHTIKTRAFLFLQLWFT